MGLENLLFSGYIWELKTTGNYLIVGHSDGEQDLQGLCMLFWKGIYVGAPSAISHRRRRLSACFYV